MVKLNENSALRDLSAFADFSGLINSSLDLNFTLNNLVLTCMGKFHTSKAAVYLVDSGNKYKLVFSKGVIKNKIDSFSQDDISEMEKVLSGEFDILQPIKGRGDRLGVFVLGKKIDGKEYDDNDKQFLTLLLNVAATAIENSLTFEKLTFSNRELDYKVNQLSSLFDLSKEFSGVLDVNTVTKLLTFSLIGQLMVAEYAIVLCKDEGVKILASKYDNDELKNFLNNLTVNELIEPINEYDLTKHYGINPNINVKLLVPMRIEDITRGIILLGERKNKMGYSKSDIEFAQSLAGIAIISIKNAELVQEVIEKHKLEQELETAREIQKSLLPQSIPELDRFQIAAYSESAKRVGGDYYDIIKIDDYRTLIAVADVSGKGVQASLLMANLQAFLKSLSKLNYELDEASNLLNDLVSENTRMGHFITFFWGMLDSRDSSLTYVNAGHNPPLLLKKGELIKLKTGGMILGFMKTVFPYTSEKVFLDSGDTLIVFTDGITEAMDYDFVEYSDERLEKLAVDISGKMDADGILDEIKNDVMIHTKGNVQSDDITCLVVKVK